MMGKGTIFNPIWHRQGRVPAVVVGNFIIFAAILIQLKEHG
jgi:hypothetical protein